MLKVMFAAAVLSLVTWVYAGEAVDGSESKLTDSREVGAFHAIDLRISCDLEVKIGEQTALTIDADDDIAALILTEVKDGTLTIWAEESFTTKNDPDIRITLPDLKALVVQGSSDARVKGLDNEALAVSAHGSADVHLYGKTKNLVLTLAGSADVHAFELDSQQAVVTIKGSADAKIAVAESLVATVSGSGDLTYTGSPRVISTVSGSGSVRKHKS